MVNLTKSTEAQVSAEWHKLVRDLGHMRFGDHVELNPGTDGAIRPLRRNVTRSLGVRF